MTTVAREQVIELIDDLPSESQAELVRFIEFLRFRSGQAPVVPVTEAEAPLRAIALRRLPPEDQRRLSFLRARNEEAALSPRSTRSSWPTSIASSARTPSGPKPSSIWPAPATCRSER